MPQLMPLFWMGSAFMVFMLLFVLILLYYYMNWLFYFETNLDSQLYNFSYKW